MAIDWQLDAKSLKKYPHFDSMLSPAEAEALANDASRVAKHSFLPFLKYNQHWTRFAKPGSTGKPKDRPIRYAARADAYIFSRYRYVLSALYEAELRALNLHDCVLAYRRIPDSLGAGGKCNIHFARDAIKKIVELGNCYVLVFDISSYFESLDHDRLKQLWARLLSETRLPVDHYKVFKAITRYSIVEKEAVYGRLGHYGPKRKSKSGKPINGYTTPYNKIPKKLCDARTFRRLIAGGEEKSLIETNYKPYGIPQGAPISDLLANLYLLDFDKELSGWISQLGGAYYRYSDDILIISPGDAGDALQMMAKVRSRIKDYGAKLEIKDDKSSAFVFAKQPTGQVCEKVFGARGKNGLEYLGFRYNGHGVYIRDSTLANLNRKIARKARREARKLVSKMPNADLDAVKAAFNYEKLIKEFGRVEDFDEKSDDYRAWTFWSYASRASAVMSDLNPQILHQLRKLRQNIKRRVDIEISRAIAKRQYPVLEVTN